MDETGEGHPPVVIVDENWALCRGYSAILNDVGLSTIRVNCTTDCIRKLQALSRPDDGLVIVGRTWMSVTCSSSFAGCMNKSQTSKAS